MSHRHRDTAAADGRTAEQLRQHYEVEKELASKLRNAPKAERRYLYGAVYDDLYRRVPSHPQLMRKQSPHQRQAAVCQQIALFRSLLRKTTSFLEVGAGDCALCNAIAPRVAHVYAVDVSEKTQSSTARPTNFTFLLSDGCSIPVPAETVDVVYSNQLMEHLHPDDALEQLTNIRKALKRGGSYVCITPNRLNGPHDISMFFDSTATGFHLKEYTTAELITLFKRTGFRKVDAFVCVKRHYLKCPSALILLYEAALSKLPQRTRRAFATMAPFRPLLGIQLIAMK